jgi:uncharacterized protein (DUF433 family)
MSMAIQSDPVPLIVDETGTIRVGGTRVTLDVLLQERQLGATPEEIAAAYDTLSLPDIYAAIGYYLRHTAEVDGYLARRREEAARLRRMVEAGHDRRGLRERLEARRQEAS